MALGSKVRSFVSDGLGLSCCSAGAFWKTSKRQQEVLVLNPREVRPGVREAPSPSSMASSWEQLQQEVSIHPLENSPSYLLAQLSGRGENGSSSNVFITAHSKIILS